YFSYRVYVFHVWASKGWASRSKSSPATLFLRKQMKSRKLLSALLGVLFSLQALHLTAFADEGMWTFNNVPRAEIKKKYGFEITDAWLKKAQLASVRFNNGGSGSFVSPNGLVLTNYHIVEDIVNE